MDFIVIRTILDISNFCLQHIASITIKLGDKPRKLLFYLSFFNFSETSSSVCKNDPVRISLVEKRAFHFE